MYHSFKPGQVWLDTEGKRIQAHGGSVICIGDTCYFYGENKEKTDGKNGIWHWGVRCYASKDLYNWEDKGLIIPPEPEDPQSSLHPTACMDRPHIIYNETTGKYVAWLKIMHGNMQSMTILTAEHFLGPYTKVREGFQPLGMSSGDFDLAVGENGRAYIYFDKVHSETICAELTEDYTDVTGVYSSHFPQPGPPFVREAPAHFIRNGKHYLITSGTTGYLPNPSQAAVGEDWHGPYHVLGDPHVQDASNTSFHSQISSVFKVPGKKDLYIACGDRWLPGEMDRKYEDYARVYEMRYQPQKFSEEDFAYSISMEIVANTCMADYVWLPLRFVEPDEEHPFGMVVIDWLEEWRIEDYE